MKNKVLLIQPSLSPSEEEDIDYKRDIDYFYKSLPLNLLSIGSFLKKNNYQAEVLDCRFYTKTNTLQEIDKRIKDCFMAGLSITTPHVKHGLELSKYIKEKYNLPVIWGGAHPTLFPQQILENLYIDYIIAGDGEYSFVRFLDLYKNNNLNYDNLIKIDGMGFKHNEKIFINPVIARVKDLNELPETDYSIIEAEKYLVRKLINGKMANTFEYYSSRGCPYQCKFCINLEPYRRKWIYLKAPIVVEHIKNMVKNYNIEHIEFMDDFFFGIKQRVIDIAQGIIDAKLNISWSALPRADSFKNGLVDDTVLKRIKKSGCMLLLMGMETGTEKMLKIYNKGITPDDMILAVKKCREFDIIPYGAWFMGGPGETKKDIIQTLKMIAKLKKINPDFVYGSLGIFRPFPGSELYKKLVSQGFKFPETLEEWSNYNLLKGRISKDEIPWFKDVTFLNDIRFYGLVIIANSKGYFNKGVFRIFKIINFAAQMRYKWGWFTFRVEPFFFRIFIKMLNRFFKHLKLYRYFEI